MSYDISLVAPDGGQLELPERMDLRGGTYAFGGTMGPWLNVTYNYSQHFGKVFGENGIRTIYGMTGGESIPILESAIDQLGDDVDPDYWKSTEGNAKAALKNLLVLARIFPDAVWEGD